jgi:type IV pilus assembly protein PilE
MTAFAQRPSRGFTLIELMIVIVIIAILMTIAIPSYRRYVIRGHRSAAIGEMMSLANREQQLLIANRAYADTAALTASGYTPAPEVTQFYTYTVTVGTSVLPTFLITFTPTGGQASDGALTLDQSGVKLPTDKWQGR